MNSLLLVQNPPVTRPRGRPVGFTARTRQEQQFEASTRPLPSQFERVEKALSQQTQVGGGGVDRGRGRGRGRGEGTVAVEQEFQTEASDEEGLDFTQWCIDLYDRRTGIKVHSGY